MAFDFEKIDFELRNYFPMVSKQLNQSGGKQEDHEIRLQNLEREIQFQKDELTLRKREISFLDTRMAQLETSNQEVLRENSNAMKENRKVIEKFNQIMETSSLFTLASTTTTAPPPKKRRILPPQEEEKEEEKEEESYNEDADADAAAAVAEEEEDSNEEFEARDTEVAEEEDEEEESEEANNDETEVDNGEEKTMTASEKDEREYLNTTWRHDLREIEYRIKRLNLPLSKPLSLESSASQRNSLLIDFQQAADPNLLFYQNRSSFVLKHRKIICQYLPWRHYSAKSKDHPFTSFLLNFVSKKDLASRGEKRLIALKILLLYLICATGCLCPEEFFELLTLYEKWNRHEEKKKKNHGGTKKQLHIHIDYSAEEARKCEQLHVFFFSNVAISLLTVKQEISKVMKRESFRNWLKKL
jgi:hypothetical protein